MSTTLVLIVVMVVNDVPRSMRSVPPISVGFDSHRADGDYLGRMLGPMAAMTEAVVHPPSLSSVLRACRERDVSMMQRARQSRMS